MKLAIVSQQTYGRLLARRLAAHPEFDVYLLEPQQPSRLSNQTTANRSSLSDASDPGITRVKYRNFLNFIDLGESVEIRVQSHRSEADEDLSELSSLRVDLVICPDQSDCPVQKLLYMNGLPSRGAFQREVSLLGRILLLGPACHRFDRDADRQLWSTDAAQLESYLKQTAQQDLRVTLRDFDKDSRQRFSQGLTPPEAESLQGQQSPTPKPQTSRLSANH